MTERWPACSKHQNAAADNAKVKPMDSGDVGSIGFCLFLHRFCGSVKKHALTVALNLSDYLYIIIELCF